MKKSQVFNEAAGVPEKEQTANIEQEQQQSWRNHVLFKDGANDPEQFTEIGQYLVMDDSELHIQPLLEIQGNVHTKLEKINKDTEAQLRNVTGTPRERDEARAVIRQNKTNAIQQAKSEGADLAKTYYDNNMSASKSFNESATYEPSDPAEVTGSKSGPSMEMDGGPEPDIG